METNVFEIGVPYVSRIRWCFKINFKIAGINAIKDIYSFKILNKSSIL